MENVVYTWEEGCLYAIASIHDRISKGPMYQGFSLPLRPNLKTPFIEATLKNIMSPTSNSKLLRVTSA